MALTLQLKSGVTLLTRCSSKPYIQRRLVTREAVHRYVEPSKFKKHMLSATQPYVKPKYYLPSEICKGTKQKQHELEPLQKIYVDELLEEIRQNDFVLFIQHNYTPFQSERVYKNNIIKAGGTFHINRNEVYRTVFGELGIDKVQHLFIARNSLVIGQLDKLSNCVRALKKMPQFLLLAGCVGQDVLSHDELQTISQFNLDESRANLLATLETPAIELAHYLEQHAKNIEEGAPSQPQTPPLPPPTTTEQSPPPPPASS